MADITFIVPAAPYHQALLERALASIDAQTVPCKAVVIHDTEMRGAGWARNQGIAQVQTRFLVFLDADDEVLPTFVERTLAANRPKRFIFCDWYDEDKVFRASECPWTANTRNAITCLLAADDARRVGGFDESLPAMEDTHLFLKLLSAGVCGLHVHEPLFRYRKDGQRSKAFYQTPAYYQVIQRFNQEFGSKPMAACGGCGSGNPDSPTYNEAPAGEAQAGYALATALWGGNTVQRGRVTGRAYPRSGNGKQLWVDERDIDAAPQLFKRVIEMPGVPFPSANEVTQEGKDDFQAFARYAMYTMTGGRPQSLSAAPEPVPAVYGTPGEVRPDVGTVLRLYQNR